MCQPSENFDIFSQGEDSDSCGNSWSDLLGGSCRLPLCVPQISSGVPVVTYVPDSPFFGCDDRSFVVGL